MRRGESAGKMAAGRRPAIGGAFQLGIVAVRGAGVHYLFLSMQLRKANFGREMQKRMC